MDRPRTSGWWQRSLTAILGTYTASLQTSSSALREKPEDVLNVHIHQGHSLAREPSALSLSTIPLDNGRHLRFESTGDEHVEHSGRECSLVLKIVHHSCRHSEKRTGMRVDV